MRKVAAVAVLGVLARSFGRTDYLMMSPQDLDALSAAGAMVNKYPGTHLFKEGEDATAAYVIHEGEAELYRGSKADRRVVTRVGEGAVLGDIAMFKGDPYHSSAKAVSAVSALRLDRSKLMPMLVERPVIALRWLIAGLDQLESTQRRVLRLMHRTVLEQVADLLVDEANDHGEVRLSQSAIGTLLGASRQSVNEALGELKAMGAADTGYRIIRVTDRAIASKIAGRD